ncbi:GFA family protein [Colwellia sp. MSW7]|uniref:GFA family protein n=1 Tax=Colwellia maritima TaxID=2912588 RepID=A0ABS9WW40_9GAMM|nr:GFA family protein [Colwellia maritima]MCI2282168.1 GFA family protein [Colwellia maritima]
MKISGSCLCGAVSFRVDNRFKNMYACFCQQCRKISGSSFASNLFIDANYLEWLSGENKLEKFTVPGRGFNKAFCKKCGTGMPFKTSDAKQYLVPAGCLDQDPEVEKIEQIFYKEKYSLEDARLQAPTYDKFPHKEVK